MATTEQLIVELRAKIDDFESKMGKAENATDKVKNSSSRLTQALGKMSGVLAGISFGAVVTQAVRFNKELRIAAELAGTNIEGLQKFAFAAKSVGFDLGQVGDIAKDTRERIGDFLATGGGPFQDFVDVMGLTEEQARAVATEFEKLSGPQILQEMVRLMENGGVSTEKMSFALEGVASESTKLLPLLRDNATELNKMEQAFEDLGLVVTEEESQKITDLGQAFSELTTAAGNAGAKITSEWAPAITAILEVSTVAVAKITSIAQVFSTGITGAVDLAVAKLVDWQEGTNFAAESAEKTASKIAKLFENITGVTPAIDADTAAVDENTRALNENAEARAKVDAAVATGEEGQSTIDIDQLMAEIDTAKQLIDESTQAAAEIVKSNWEGASIFPIPDEDETREKLGVIGDLFGEYSDKQVGDTQALFFRTSKIRKDDQKVTEDTEEAKGMAAEDMAEMSVNAATALFGENKAFAIGEAAIDTYRGINKALASNNLPLAGLIAATGFANVASIMSTEKGGGGGGGGAVGTTVTNPPESFEPETTQLEITSTIEGEGRQVNRVAIEVDGSDDFLDEMAERITSRMRAG